MGLATTALWIDDSIRLCFATHCYWQKCWWVFRTFLQWFSLRWWLKQPYRLRSFRTPIIFYWYFAHRCLTERWFSFNFSSVHLDRFHMQLPFHFLSKTIYHWTRVPTHVAIQSHFRNISFHECCKWSFIHLHEKDFWESFWNDHFDCSSKNSQSMNSLTDVRVTIGHCVIYLTYKTGSCFEFNHPSKW